MKLKRKIKNGIKILLTTVAPKLDTKLAYWSAFGKRID